MNSYLIFVKAFTSPLQRAVGACELAGFGPAAEEDPDKPNRIWTWR
jgi:hypothetical protein